jgi:hypothetical protein
MGLKAGTLLWNRRRISMDPAVPSSLIIDTGLTQQNQNFPDYSPNEPTLGTIATVGSSAGPPIVPPVPPPIPVLVSRIHVIPEAPLSEWAKVVSHGEPFVDPTTGTVWVAFNVNARVSDLNVLFWDPHSIVGPGQADTYNQQKV